MSRAKGHDGAAVRRLAGVEAVRFNLRCMPDELNLLALRLRQALRRQPNLRDLLEPGLERITFVKELTDEAIEEAERL